MQIQKQIKKGLFVIMFFMTFFIYSKSEVFADDGALDDTPVDTSSNSGIKFNSDYGVGFSKIGSPIEKNFRETQEKYGYYETR